MWNLSWWKARRFAYANSAIRRAAWLNKWLVYRAGFWWLVSTGLSRIAKAEDFSRTDFLAGDWTTRPPGEGCDAPNDPQATLPPAPPSAGLEKWGDNIIEPPPAPFYA